MPVETLLKALARMAFRKAAYLALLSNLYLNEWPKSWIELGNHTQRQVRHSNMTVA